MFYTHHEGTQIVFIHIDNNDTDLNFHSISHELSKLNNVKTLCIEGKHKYEWLQIIMQNLNVGIKNIVIDGSLPRQTESLMVPTSIHNIMFLPGCSSKICGSDKLQTIYLDYLFDFNLSNFFLSLSENVKYITFVVQYYQYNGDSSYFGFMNDFLENIPASIKYITIEYMRVVNCKIEVKIFHFDKLIDGYELIKKCEPFAGMRIHLYNNEIRENAIKTYVGDAMGKYKINLSGHIFNCLESYIEK